MKSSLIYFLIFTGIILAGFQTKPSVQYIIVDGLESHYSKDKESNVQFFYWNNNSRTTEIVWGRTNLIKKMTQEGWELQSIDSYSKGMYFYHTYIFKRNTL